MRRSGLRARIEARAQWRCEYCQAPQRVCGYRFHLEHIIPVAAGGPDSDHNRALACASCNLSKADRASAVDPVTGSAVPLYDPRADAWPEHFRWQADRRTVIGLTATGRATVRALDMNSEFRQEARELWFRAGWLPYP